MLALGISVPASDITHGSATVEIDFVEIGGAGNPADGNGLGAVGYVYNIAKTELTEGQFNAVQSVSGGVLGPGTSTGDFAPVASVTWTEMARYCNWLTTGDFNSGVYTLSGSTVTSIMGHQAAATIYGKAYAMATVDEWYKAAYYSVGNGTYSDFANGTDTQAGGLKVTGENHLKTTEGGLGLWNVGEGLLEQNGTFDMGGNLAEFTESGTPDSRFVRDAYFGWSTKPGANLNGGNLKAEDYASTAYGFRIVEITSGSSSGAVLDVTEGFDWGPGVSGRESVVAGQTLNGEAVSGYGSTAWALSGSSAADARADFSGTSGAGNGSVTLTGTNTIIRFACPADWGSEKVTATAVGKYIPGPDGTRRFAIGFQESSATSSTLLGAGTYDCVVGDIASTGVITFKVRFYDETSVDYLPSTANNFASFTPGDTVTHQLTMDGLNKQATLITTTGSGSVTNTVDFSSSTRDPDLGLFAVNGRTSSTVELDSVHVIAEPSALVSLKVCNLFCDNAVLQRDFDVPVWGSALSSTVVTLTLDGAVVGTVTADSAGEWMARIGTHSNDGGVAHSLVISAPGEPDIRINDIVFGDVYLASGQSNMRHVMSADSIIGYSTERAAADAYPLIRQMVVLETSSDVELDSVTLSECWTKCSVDSIADFSATGYFFAKNLYLQTGAPVGLILSAWGGQKIERFLSPDGVQSVPELAGFRQYNEPGGVANLYSIYNAMIAPLVPYAIRGSIWYQGEADQTDGDIYQYKMRALMRGWRQKWGIGDFPFYYVQLPNYSFGDRPTFREAQVKVLSETNSGMAVTIDVGNDSNNHPANKFDTGRRLAQWALAKDLQYDITYSGPLYRSSSVEGSRIRVLFDFAENGLMISAKDSTNAPAENGGPLQNFEIAGSNRVFIVADAAVDGDTVVVSSSGISEPVYVRYCYTNTPAGTNKLYNIAGLPASPFRTDQSFRLDVIAGTGTIDGLIPGSQTVIAADAPSDGQLFDRWIGAASEIDDLNTATATVTMPNHSLCLLATYRDESAPVYSLTVNGGSGGGTSQSNSVLNIEADPPSAGRQFDHWAGNTQAVVNVDASRTTLRMPAADITVTAVYRTVETLGDGIPDVWRAFYFGGDGTTTNRDSAAAADYDGDGMSNLQEYQAGTSPVDALSVLKLSGGISGNYIDLSFSSVAGHRYRLETSASLVPPDWTPILYNIFGDGKIKNDRQSLGEEGTGFYRLCLTE
jgi:sialate O-acetylesterase